MSDQPTQVRFPWRATVRTVIQAIPAVAVAVPGVVAAIEQDHPGLLGPVGLVAVTASGIAARVMALPAVNDLLTRFGLGAEPKG